MLSQNIYIFVFDPCEGAVTMQWVEGTNVWTGVMCSGLVTNDKVDKWINELL